MQSVVSRGWPERRIVLLDQAVDLIDEAGFKLAGFKTDAGSVGGEFCRSDFRLESCRIRSCVSALPFSGVSAE